MGDNLVIYDRRDERMWALDKAALDRRYTISDEADAGMMLGIAIERDRPNRTMTLCQSAYIQRTLEKYIDASDKPLRVPSVLNDEELTEHDNWPSFPYRSAVGALLWIAISTRPDIAQAVASVAQRTNDFDAKDVAAVKRIFRYLKGTAGHRLVLGGHVNEDDPIVVYSDASHASSKSDRKSITGFVVQFGLSTLAWGSKKQKTVALSSAEAEYVAISTALKEALWIRSLFKEIGFGDRVIVLKTDSQAAYYIAGQPSSGDRRKHIDVAHHFIKDYVEKKIVQLEWVRAVEQIADILTKPQRKSALNAFAKVVFFTCATS